MLLHALDGAEDVVVVPAEDSCARKQCDVGQRLQFRDRAVGEDGCRGTVDGLAGRKQGTAEPEILVCNDNAEAGAAGSQRRHQSGGTGTDDEQIAESPGFLVALRVALEHGPAEAGGAANGGLVDPLPKLLRPHERLVVEAGAEEGRQHAVDCPDIEAERRPTVLASRRQPAIEFGDGRLGVRIGAGTGADGDERVRLRGPGADDAARPMVLEAAADEQLVVGKQSRGQRIARKAAQWTAVEGEAQRFAAIDQTAGGETIAGHRSTLRANSAASTTE
ncbi:hypothetical protein D9M72_355500 [compost metagenome]